MKNEDFDSQIKEAQKALEKLQAAKESAEKKKYNADLKRIQPLAKRYHDLCCNYNHCDGCGWGYEGDNWEGYEHSRWLSKTARLIGVIPLDYYSRGETVIEEKLFIKLLDAYENIKNIHPSAPFLFRKVTN